MANGQGKHPKEGQLDPPWTDNHMRGFELAMEDALDGWDKDENQVFTVTFAVKAKKLHNPGGVKEYRVTIGP
jgi:hypothetical protein